MVAFLGETIGSVLGQSCGAIEYIVLDGASTDATVKLLQTYGDRVAWRSEPDSGAAAALRQGFAEARGEILGWLNADDLLLPHAVESAVRAFAAHPEAVAVYGGGQWIDEHGGALGPYPVSPHAARLLNRECLICQPACFFRAEAYRAAGGIDASLQSAFDYDLWVRLARLGPFMHVAEDWACSRMHRANKTLGNREEAFREGMAVLEKHFGYVPPNWMHSQWLWRRDGRDQFFEESRGNAFTWAASLPGGLRRNPRRRARYFWDWLTTPFRGAP